MPKSRYDDVITALTHIQAAHLSSMLALVKTLEEAGSIRAEDYEDMLRITARGLSRRGEKPVAILIEDLADALNRRDRTQ